MYLEIQLNMNLEVSHIESVSIKGDATTLGSQIIIRVKIETDFLNEV